MILSHSPIVATHNPRGPLGSLLKRCSLRHTRCHLSLDPLTFLPIPSQVHSSLPPSSSLRITVRTKMFFLLQALHPPSLFRGRTTFNTLPPSGFPLSSFFLTLNQLNDDSFAILPRAPRCVFSQRSLSQERHTISHRVGGLAILNIIPLPSSLFGLSWHDCTHIIWNPNLSSPHIHKFFPFPKVLSICSPQKASIVLNEISPLGVFFTWPHWNSNHF